MAFKPDQLPPTVYEAYKQGAALWLYTVNCAIKENVRDVNRLANIAFYLHHPELDGRPLKSHEIQLIAEWKAFRTMIQPILSKVQPILPKTGFSDIPMETLSLNFTKIEFRD